MPIIPKPKKYEENGLLTIKPFISIDDELSFCKKAFVRVAKKAYGVYFKDGEGGLCVHYNSELDENEYKIDAKSIFASSVKGASYALATVLQLIEKDGEEFVIKNTKICDKPDNDFRGFMLDLGRQFHEYENILNYVDLCYVNKVKYMQLHFTDNQMWTLPLNSFPNAVTKGKCYTKEEIRYLAEYANEAGVEIIPEFEGIGHSQALNDAYPENFGNEFDAKEVDAAEAYNAEFKFKDNIMCIGRKNIFEDIKTILTEIADTFKYSKYIHVGCDEAVHEYWLRCKHCREYMKRNGFETTKQMYCHFVKKITDICLELKRTPIVWEGFSKEGNSEISKDVVVVSWENTYQTTQELLDGGFNIINAAWIPMYIVPFRSFKKEVFDWKVAEKDWNIYKWGKWIKWANEYEFFTVEPTDKVLGGMLCAWENTFEEERDRVIENMPAMSDRTWNTQGYYSLEEYEKAKEKLISIEEKMI